MLLAEHLGKIVLIRKSALGGDRFYPGPAFLKHFFGLFKSVKVDVFTNRNAVPFFKGVHQRGSAAAKGLAQQLDRKLPLIKFIDVAFDAVGKVTVLGGQTVGLGHIFRKNIKDIDIASQNVAFYQRDAFAGLVKCLTVAEKLLRQTFYLDKARRVVVRDLTHHKISRKVAVIIYRCHRFDQSAMALVGIGQTGVFYLLEGKVVGGVAPRFHAVVLLDRTTKVRKALRKGGYFVAVKVVKRYSGSRYAVKILQYLKRLYSGIH